MSRAAAVAAALAALVLAPAAAAATACPRTSATDLEDEVMCPVCGTTLGVAREAPQARRERAFIERLAERCLTKQQIKSALAAEFGDQVLAEPPRTGFALTAYLVPALAVAFAGAAVGLMAARWRRSRAGDAAQERDLPPLEPAAEARVDAELARLEGPAPQLRGGRGGSS
jgi:cytochrome c-type biogenesis protein CcmH